MIELGWLFPISFLSLIIGQWRFGNKRKRKEWVLGLIFPNWLRRSTIIKGKRGACEKEAGHNSSHSYSLHEIHEEIEDERKQITHVHILLTQGKEEGGTRDVLQRHTHICIDINTQKEGSSSSILSNSYSFVNL